MGAPESNKGVKGTPPALTSDKDAKEEIPVFEPEQALWENLALLEKGVEKKDEKVINRVLRKTTPIRRQLSGKQLTRVVVDVIPSSTPSLTLVNQALSQLQTLIPSKAQGNDAKPRKKEENDALKKPAFSPEVEAYLLLLVITKLNEHKKWSLSLQLCTVLLEHCKHHNRRTLDLLQARAFHFFAQCHEKMGTSQEIRPVLIAAHRTACLRFDEFGQATLINLILRNFLEHKLVDQALKFSSRATFPDHVSNNQQVRFLYYMGRIQAIQLDYSDSFNKLMQAIRKTPSHTAFGFRVAVYKLATCVQLLLGETPERSWFSDVELRSPLAPYFEIVKAVRNGHISVFDKCRELHAKTFTLDGNMTLVSRLRNSVIKTGLRRINISYSKIAFKDVAQKLDLETKEYAEFVCAKAIRDGVIDSSMDHEAEVLMSSQVSDIYSTVEPQQAFHKRIQFCLSVHDDAVKALRYPPGAHKGQRKSDKDENMTEEEIAEEIEAELEEDGDM